MFSANAMMQVVKRRARFFEDQAELRLDPTELNVAAALGEAVKTGPCRRTWDWSYGDRSRSCEDHGRHWCWRSLSLLASTFAQSSRQCDQVHRERRSGRPGDADAESSQTVRLYFRSRIPESAFLGEKLNVIFDAFSQADGSWTRVSMAVLGLGLTICLAAGS